tara:strand:- start:170 stop:1102 length:933 start_codon:yes stop_codon:yes gene_type:complete
MKKKIILLTGSAGFIGSNILNKLNSKKYKIYSIDDLSTGNISNLNNQNKKNFLKGNCSSLKVLNKIKDKNVDIILHFAGQSSAAKSFENPINDLERNTISTIKLLDFAKKKNCLHFIYASSMSVYGDYPNGVKETDKCKPKSIYGSNKLASENIIKNYTDENKINYTILRLFNVYGVNQRLGNLEQGLIRIFITQIFNNKKLLIKGTGDRTRDFINVNDVVKIVLNMIANKKFYHQTLNIGTGKKTSVYDIVKILKEVSPFKFSVKYKGKTPGDQHKIHANINKLKNFISFVPKKNLKLILKKIIDENSQ